MPELNAYQLTIKKITQSETAGVEQINVIPSPRKGANWHVKMAGQHFHLQTKKGVIKVLGQLGYEVID